MDKSILVIEDDHEIRVCFRLNLEDQGYRVMTVANGRDAFKYLETSKAPDLILLDLSMPIMGGLEFLKLKNNNEKIRSIPVLVVSCNPDKIEKIGAVPFLHKPVDIDDLFSKISQCIKTENKIEA